VTDGEWVKLGSREDVGVGEGVKVDRGHVEDEKVAEALPEREVVIVFKKDPVFSYDDEDNKLVAGLLLSEAVTLSTLSVGAGENEGNGETEDESECTGDIVYT